MICPHSCKEMGHGFPVFTQFLERHPVLKLTQRLYVSSGIWEHLPHQLTRSATA